MASVVIFASLQTACKSQHVIKKQRRISAPGKSSEAKQSAHVTTTDAKSKRMSQVTEQTERIDNKLESASSKQMDGTDAGSSSVKKFDDERWRNGSWDLNLFVKDGKIDWDGVITAGKTGIGYHSYFPWTFAFLYLMNVFQTLTFCY